MAEPGQPSKPLKPTRVDPFTILPDVPPEIHTLEEESDYLYKQGLKLERSVKLNGSRPITIGSPLYKEKEKFDLMTAQAYLRDAEQFSRMRGLGRADYDADERRIGITRDLLLKNILRLGGGIPLESLVPKKIGDDQKYIYPIPDTHFRGEDPKSLYFHPEKYPGADEDGNPGRLDYKRHTIIPNHQTMLKTFKKWQWVFYEPLRQPDSGKLGAWWNELAASHPDLNLETLSPDLIPKMLSFPSVEIAIPTEDGGTEHVNIDNLIARLPTKEEQAAARTFDWKQEHPEAAAIQEKLRQGWLDKFPDYDPHHPQETGKEFATGTGGKKTLPFSLEQAQEIDNYTFRSWMGVALANYRFKSLPESEQKKLKELGRGIYTLQYEDPQFSLDDDGLAEDMWGTMSLPFVMEFMNEQGKLYDAKSLVQATDLIDKNDMYTRKLEGLAKELADHVQMMSQSMYGVSDPEHARRGLLVDQRPTGVTTLDSAYPDDAKSFRYYKPSGLREGQVPLSVMSLLSKGPFVDLNNWLNEGYVDTAWGGTPAGAIGINGNGYEEQRNLMFQYATLQGLMTQLGIKAPPFSKNAPTYYETIDKDGNKQRFAYDWKKDKYGRTLERNTVSYTHLTLPTTPYV